MNCMKILNKCATYVNLYEFATFQIGHIGTRQIAINRCSLRNTLYL